MHLTYRWQAALFIALCLLMATLDATVVSVVAFVLVLPILRRNAAEREANGSEGSAAKAVRIAVLEIT